MARLSQAVSSAHGLRVLALTTDSMPIAKAYAIENKLPFPLVPFPSLKLASLYRGLRVPQTIVIDADGRVLLARHGVINSTAAVDSIVAVLSATDARGDTGSPPNDSARHSIPAAAKAGQGDTL